MYNLFSITPCRHRALSLAVLGLLSSGAANATVAAPVYGSTPDVSGGYNWTTPDTTYDTQNGYTGVLGLASVFAAINDSGTITGDFIYKTAAPTISGLTNSNYYGFYGATKEAIGATSSGPLYQPGISAGSYAYYGTNAITGINNAGYATYSGATSSLLSDSSGNFGSGHSTTIADSTSNLVNAGASGATVGTYALGLDSTLVVGADKVQTGNYTYEGFIYNIGSQTYTDYNYGGGNGVSGLLQTTFTGVQTNTTNSNVYVTGNYTDGSGTHGLIYDGTTNTWTSVNDTNATNGTFVTGLNASGEAVGYYKDGTGEHGFTYNYVSHTFTNSTIDNPIGANTVILGVNDSGTLVGIYGASTSTTVGFEATTVSSSSSASVPEPEQLSLLMLGLLPMLGFSRRQKKSA
jgi:hypothetical protein